MGYSRKFRAIYNVLVSKLDGEKKWVFILFVT